MHTQTYVYNIISIRFMLSMNPICIRLESLVNTATVDTETILRQCQATLADSGGTGGCGYLYRLFHCYPSDSLIENTPGNLHTIPEINC